MRRLVIICPDCSDSIIFDMRDKPTSLGTFRSRCGTEISFTVDSRESNIMARVQLKSEGVKRVHVTEQT
jgi:hypothetical protein